MNIHEKIDSYAPTESVKELVHSTKIALLVGITGAGKDTIKHELLKNDDFRDIISHTTRAPRMNAGVMEIDGVDYHFISLDEAEKNLNEHQYVEAKCVHGTVYATPVSEIRAAHETGKVAITDIDVQGVAEYKHMSSQVVAIFILPPDFDTWQDRLMKRYQTNEEYLNEWPKRRTSAISELTNALEVPYYHFVINDLLDRAVEATRDIALRTDTFHRKDDEARLLARDLLETIRLQDN